MIPLCDVIPRRTRPVATAGLFTMLAIEAAGAWRLPWPLQQQTLPLVLLASMVAIDCWGLWLLGPAVEDRLGRVRFAALVGSAALLALAAGAAWPQRPLPILGPSAWTFAGVAAAHLVLFPSSRLLVPTVAPKPSLAELPTAPLALGWIVVEIWVFIALAPFAGGLARPWLPVAQTLAAGAWGALAARRLRIRERMSPVWWEGGRFSSSI
jgi:membrane associated rhomboid family serine protease